MQQSKEYLGILNEIQKRNLKHKAIQEFLGISKTMLSRKLHGKTRLSVDDAIKIKNKFFPDMTVEELFFREIER